jgi:biofilm PGA synthesis N-glycosyltransferase PgaC
MTLLFYISVFIIAYTYLGYPMMILLIGQLVKPFRKRAEKKLHEPQDVPYVTIVIAAYNEWACLDAKITNTLSLSYPNERKSIFVVTDGSTDGSEILVSHYPEVKLFHESERKGKAAAINRVLPFLPSGIVLFTDANVLLNEDALNQIVVHFNDPLIGAVAGEKKVSNGKERGAVAVEGLYWKYESMIRKADADIHSVTGAVGELLALRTGLIKQIPEGIICDDLYMSLQVIDQRYRVGYTDKAYGIEDYSFSIAQEWKRKIRIAAGSIQMIKMIDWWRLLCERPLPILQYINRKLLRWVVVPYLIVLIPVFMALIDVTDASIQLMELLLLCSGFYIWAFLGGILIRVKFIPRFFYLPFYFVWANLAMIAGTWQYLSGRSFTVWEKVR